MTASNDPNTENALVGVPVSPDNMPPPRNPKTEKL